MERAIDYYAAALPLTAGSLADQELLRRLHVLDHHTKWIGTLPARRPIEHGRVVCQVSSTVGIGPVSLATLLWADRGRTAGVPIHWCTFAVRGLMVVPIL